MHELWFLIPKHFQLYSGFLDWKLQKGPGLGGLNWSRTWKGFFCQSVIWKGQGDPAEYWTKSFVEWCFYEWILFMHCSVHTERERDYKLHWLFKKYIVFLYCSPSVEGQYFELVSGQTLMLFSFILGTTAPVPLQPIFSHFPPALFHPRLSCCMGEPGRCFLGSLSGFSRAASPHLSLLQPLLGRSPVITTHQSVTASRKKEKTWIQDVHTGTLYSTHVNQVHSETSLVRLLRAKAHYRNLEP